jgi:hypothetical protein
METNWKALRVNHTFDAQIEKVFQMLTNPISYQKVFSPFIENLESTNGESTFTKVGAEFKNSWRKYGHTLLTVNIRVAEVVDEQNFKMFNLYYKAIDKLEMEYNVIFKLERLSIQKQTLMEVGMLFNSEESFKYHEFILDNDEKRSVLINMNNFLLEKEQEESILLNASIKKVWETITNCENFRRHVPELADEVTVENSSEEGVIELVRLREGEREQRLKVVKKELNESVGVYTMRVNEVGTLPQEVSFRLFSKGYSMCLLIMRHSFLEPVPYRYVLALSEKKQQILKTLETSLKN